MKYLLDTNVLISLFKNKYGIREAILVAGRKQCAISTLTIGELLVGAYKGKDARQKNEVEKTRELFPTIPVNEAVINVYAKTRASLELQGIRLDDLDLLIASTALYHNLTVVTHNIKHFDRIPGLRIEDWENCQTGL